MSRRKIQNRNTRKITAFGGSSAVTIPVEFMRTLKWRAKQKVVLEIDIRRKRVIIKDWQK